jgi:hypothetical protein
VADKLTDKVAEVRTLGQRLTRLISLSLEMNVDNTLPRLQDIFGRVGRELLHTRYAAVGILEPDGLTINLAVRGDDYAGDALPVPHEGLLSQLSAAAGRICLSRVAIDPCSIGLPEHEKSVDTFLGITVASQTRRYGWIYFAQKETGDSFTDDDQQIGEALSAMLAMAYEHSMLYLEKSQLADLLEARVSERTEELRRSHLALQESRRQQLEMKDPAAAVATARVTTPPVHGATGCRFPGGYRPSVPARGPADRGRARAMYSLRRRAA